MTNPDEQPQIDITLPETLPTEHAGTAPTETADGIRWGAALPVDGGVRLTAIYSDGIIVTLDAKDQETARAELRAYHTPKGA